MSDKNKSADLVSLEHRLTRASQHNSIDASGVKGSRSSRNGVYFFGALVFIVAFALVIAVFYTTDFISVWSPIAAAAVGVLAASTRHLQFASLSSGRKPSSCVWAGIRMSQDLGCT